MIKKTIIIILILAVVIGVGFFVWYQSHKNTAAVVVNSAGDTSNNSGGAASPSLYSTITTSTTPVSVPAAAPQGGTMDIGTPSGVVTVNNVYRSILGWEESDIIFQKTSVYELLYDVDDSSFVVSIDAGPLLTTRPQAESALLSFLGVSRSDACKLAVVVGVDPSVDPSLVNKGFSLSFCASSNSGFNQ